MEGLKTVTLRCSCFKVKQCGNVEINTAGNGNLAVFGSTTGAPSKFLNALLNAILKLNLFLAEVLWLGLLII